MCLIVFGWQAHPDFPLIVAANRDEFHARPAAPAGRWPDALQIIGGRDLEANGTWLGITDRGRFAAVTNVREPGASQGRLSRGWLTREFLLGDQPALAYACSVDNAAYSGFNLLLADGDTLVYCSNRGGDPVALGPGVYGLSNHRLDTPWPKLQVARDNFKHSIQQLPDENGLFKLLSDKQIAADENLPKTGVSLEWERLLSAIFVQSENYGTRASTVAWQRNDGAVSLHERSFGPNGQALQSSLISTVV